MRYRVAILAATIAAGLPQAFAAQSNVSMTVEITDARKANAKLMQEYTWNSRTELLEAGEVEDMRLDLVKYGSDGHLQRTLLNDQSAPLPFVTGPNAQGSAFGGGTAGARSLLR